MSKDLRQYARQTSFRLIVGGILLLFLVGDGLIYIIFGRSAAILGFTCLVLGLAPLLLIALSLWLVEWLAKKANEG